MPDDAKNETEYETSETKPWLTIDNGIRLAFVLALVAIAFLIMRPAPKVETKQETVPRSESSILTEELNALNLKRAPLIDACSNLKATEAEIKLRTDRLSEIRNK